MSLTKTISAIFTTIGIAIPSALTTWVLTKPKPLKEIDKTIELDEYEEEINEPEIIPKEAPSAPVFPSVPIFPPSIPEQIPDSASIPEDAQIQDTDKEPPSPSAGEEEQTFPVEEPESTVPEKAPEPPETEQEEEEKEPEESETPEEKADEDEKEEDVEEIKKSLVEAIGVIIQKYKDGYRIETGGIYDSFDIKQKLDYIIKSIAFLEKDKKDKEEAVKAGQKAEGSDGKSSKEKTEGESQ